MKLARRLWARGETNELEALLRTAVERGCGPMVQLELAAALRVASRTNADRAAVVVREAVGRDVKLADVRFVAEPACIPVVTRLWVLERCQSELLTRLLKPTETDANLLKRVVELQAGLLVRRDRGADLEGLYRQLVDAGQHRYLTRLAGIVGAKPGREADARILNLSALERGVAPRTAMLRLGQLAEDAGRRDEAIGWYDKGLAAGDSTYALVRLAKLVRGRPRSAEFQALLRLATDNGHRAAPVILARQLWEAGEHDELEKLYTLGDERSHTTAVLELAAALHSLDSDPGRERELILSAMSRGLGVDDIAFASGHICIPRTVVPWLLREILDVNEMLDQDAPCRSDAFRAELFGMLGDALAVVDEPLEARRAHQQAVGLGRADSNVQLAESSERSFDLSGAAELYLLAAEAGNAWAWTQLARLASSGHVDTDSTAAIDSARELSSPKEAVRLARRLEDAGNPGLAEQVLFAAERRGDPAPAARARLLIRQGSDIDDVRTLFEESAHRGELAALVGLGYHLHEAGRKEEAEDTFRRGADAGSGVCVHNLAIMLEELERDAEAAERYSRAVELGVADAAEQLAALQARTQDVDTRGTAADGPAEASVPPVGEESSYGGAGPLDTQP